jgi:uncharacterized protein (DUF58 family)
MISPELARKIRRIEIYTRKAVHDILGGEYRSVFKGRGMDFEEVREYVPGDEIRSIDWNVTARLGHPYVKRFVEERELTVMFLADVSASGSFGTTEKTKNEQAAELCALVAFAAIKNNDKVGLILFTESVEAYIPPKKGTSHALRLIEELLHFKPRLPGTDIGSALNYLGRVVPKRCVVFLLSDFQDEGFEKTLGVLGKRHDVIALPVTDPREKVMPNVGWVQLRDAETGLSTVLDTASPHVRQQYGEVAQCRAEKLRGLFQSLGIDSLEISTDRDPVKDLVGFFRCRGHHRGHWGGRPGKTV